MNKDKKLKIYLGSVYLLIISIFLWFFFNNISIEEVSNYEFLRKNREFFLNFKQNNFFYTILIFFLFTVFWVLLLGFGSPVALISGFIFGKWIGVFLAVLGLSIGAILLYIFANYFLKKIIKDKFLDRYKVLESKFKKSEFIYLLLYRFIGGIPFAISNVLPCIFNVKVRNFFWATFIGIMPQLFLIASIGNGLEKIIDQNLETPRILDLITSPDIYIPLLIFVCLLFLTFFLRKKIYK